jgi:putative membrane protein
MQILGAFVADLTIQPTRKWIRVQYWTVFLLLCACVGVYVNKLEEQVTPWLLLIPALLFFFPVRGHIRRHFTKATLTGDKLRYESGVLSKTTRTIQISKVQDVRIDQSLAQRLVGTGNLAIETAGETSRLTIENIDDPQAVADAITDASQGQLQKQKGARP